jgi:hypothetical protein
MAALVRQLIILTAWVALWWSIVDTISWEFGPDSDRLDTHRAWVAGEANGFDQDTLMLGVDSLYVNRWESLLAGIYTLRATSRPKMIIVGGSTAQEGLRPDELAPLFPEYEIHNLAIPVGHLAEIRRILELAVTNMDARAARESVFVIGLFYGVFLGEQTKSVDVAKMRHVMFPSVFGEPEVRRLIDIGDAASGALMRLFRPFYYLSHLPRCCTSTLRRMWHGMKRDPQAIWESLPRIWSMGDRPAPKRLQDMTHSAAERERIKKAWSARKWVNTRFKGVSPTQFKLLLDSCRFLRERGASVALVDLPVSTAHREQISAFNDYQRMKVEYFRKAEKDYQARYINLTEIVPDSDFAELTHPRYGARPIWAYQLWRNWDKDPRPHGGVVP